MYIYEITITDIQTFHIVFIFYNYYLYHVADFLYVKNANKADTVFESCILPA